MLQNFARQGGAAAHDDLHADFVSGLDTGVALRAVDFCLYF